MKSSRLPNHLLAQGDLYTTEDGEVTHFQTVAGLGFGLFFFLDCAADQNSDQMINVYLLPRLLL